MNNVVAILLACLPSRIHVWIRRKGGHDIAGSVRIRWGTLLLADDIVLGEDVTIGPCVRMRARSIRMGSGSSVAPLTTISAHSIVMDDHSSVAPLNVVQGDPNSERSSFRLGRHSRIFSLCWIECGHGIDVGSRTGIGGHTLIFTHGSWPNYILGAPVAFGPVVIGDRVWLPWRVFILPGVTIGDRAVVGAGSVVSRDVPEGALAAGMPAKIVRDCAYKDLDDDARWARMQEVYQHLLREGVGITSANVALVRPGPSGWPGKSVSVLLGANIAPADAERAVANGQSVIDMAKELAWLGDADGAGRRVLSWLTRYGVRGDEVTAPC